MKKLLSILAAITLIGTTSTIVVACGEGLIPTPPAPDTRTDLRGLSDNAEITLSSSAQTVADFKKTLIIKLKKDSKFNQLSDTEVDITKSDDTEIQNSDIISWILATKVKAKSSSTNFTGEKNINVTIIINENLNEFKINGINNGIYSIAVDSKDNAYIGTNIGVFVLKNGETTATKINEINKSVYSIAVDSKDNIYFGINSSAYILKNGETKAKIINGFVNNIGGFDKILIDKNDNIYFASYLGKYYLLEQNKDNVIKIDGIDEPSEKILINKKNDLFFQTLDKLYYLKSGKNKTKLIFNNYGNFFKFTGIDNNNNIFMLLDRFYILKDGLSIPEPINGINVNIINSIVSDKNNTTYFCTDDGIYILKRDENYATKIDNINGWINSMIIVDNNIYLLKNNDVFILQQSTNQLIKLNNINITGIDLFLVSGKNNLYVGTSNNGAYVLKKI